MQWHVVKKILSTDTSLPEILGDPIVFLLLKFIFAVYYFLYWTIREGGGMYERNSNKNNASAKYLAPAFRFLLNRNYKVLSKSITFWVTDGFSKFFSFQNFAIFKK